MSRAKMKARISITSEVLGTGSDGTEPSILFSIQRHGIYSQDVTLLKRILFNCGEGTQRLCGENGIKLGSLDTLFFTHLDAKSLSGLPGLIFAMGTCGVGTMTLYGPSGLGTFLQSLRSFVRRKYPILKCVHVLETSQQAERMTDQIEEITLDEVQQGEKITQDRHVEIFPFFLNLKSTGCLCCKKCENSTKQTTQSKQHQVLSGKIMKKGRSHGQESEETVNFRKWLIKFYQEKGLESKVSYIDVVLNKYKGRHEALKKQLIQKYGPLSTNTICDTKFSTSSSSSDSESSDSSEFSFRFWLTNFYQQNNPERLAHIDSILYKFAGKEEELKQMLQAKYPQEKLSKTHKRNHEEDVSNQEKKQKIDQVKAEKDEEIEDEYITPSLTHAIEPQDNQSTSKSLLYVMRFLHEPNPVIWIVRCNREEEVDRLTTCEAFQNVCENHKPTLVVHLLPLHLAIHHSYAKWIQSISKVSRTNHLIFDGKTLQEMSNGSVFSLNFLASARHYLRLHQANPTHFPSTSWMACVKTTGFTQRKRLLIRLQSGLVAHLAQAKLQFQTLHDKEGEFEYSRTGWRPSKKKNEEEEGEQDDEEEMNESNCIIPIQQHCSTVKTQAGPRLVVLGTGSAAPSKLRASSSLYLEVPPIEGQPIQPFGMLLDCGEGTYGQLWRQFGREEVRHRIGALQCIWISHYHADHQCGLVRILQEYLHYQCNMNQTENHGKLLVIAPRSVLTYVDKCKTIGLLSDTHAQLALVSCVDFNRLDHPLRMDFFMRMIHYYPIHELRSVPVIHCYDAFGLVFTIGNTKQKIVYSGDTIPCDRLIHAGLDADLLIHEATFDDSMQEDAEKKKHSTIGQALEVAAKMRAKKTVLTHFSQRYPHLPSQLQDSRFKDEVVCASDGMSISLNLI